MSDIWSAFIAGVLIGFIAGVTYNVAYFYNTYDVKLKDKKNVKKTS